MEKLSMWSVGGGPVEFGGGKVVGGVDADGVVLADGDAYAVAVLEPAQLFEAFGFLKRRLRQVGYLRKHVAAVGVYADVGVEVRCLEPLYTVYSAHVWDYAAREVHCFTSGRERHFDQIRVKQRVKAFCRVELAAQGGDFGRCGIEAVHQLAYLPGLDERLIALYVYNYVC